MKEFEKEIKQQLNQGEVLKITKERMLFTDLLIFEFNNTFEYEINQSHGDITQNKGDYMEEEHIFLIRDFYREIFLDLEYNDEIEIKGEKHEA